ncbi:hypothetical protein [Pectinatus frisingensis]|uniref:hypothetical protein n=1 Tax=Pectinatus frisingensis TaxID=865 RepID=UPI003D800EE2
MNESFGHSLENNKQSLKKIEKYIAKERLRILLDIDYKISKELKPFISDRPEYQKLIDELTALENKEIKYLAPF